MTKTVRYLCASRKRFEQGLGYGSWVIITITLILFVATSNIEINSMYKYETGNQFDSRYMCYHSILFNYEKCFDVFDYDDIPIYQNIILWIMNIINLIVIGLWIYNKQQQFKFAWCENKK